MANHGKVALSLCAENMTDSHNPTITIPTHVNGAELPDGSKRVICRNCKIWFPASTYQKHMRTEHNVTSLRGESANFNDLTFTCTLCPQSFDTLKLRDVHMRNFHHFIDPACDYCFRYFKTWYGRLSHAKTHFVLDSNTGLPIRRTKAKFAFRCPQCENIFTSTDKLDMHMYTFHKGVTGSEVTYERSKTSAKELDNRSGSENKCEYCRAEFPSTLLLFEHFERRHLLSENFLAKNQCDSCNLKFQSESELSSHILGTHYGLSDGKTFTENVTPSVILADANPASAAPMTSAVAITTMPLKSTTTMTPLIRSVTVKPLRTTATSEATTTTPTKVATTKNPAFVPNKNKESRSEHKTKEDAKDIKGKNFTTPQMTNIWKHRCSICHLLFHDESALINHSMTHIRSDFVTATKRTKNAAPNGSIARELKTFLKEKGRSPNTLTASSRPPSYTTHTCPFCEQKFPDEDTLENHRIQRHDTWNQSFHDVKKEFTCDSCDDVFKQSSLFRNHILEHHYGVSSQRISILMKSMVDVEPSQKEKLLYTANGRKKVIQAENQESPKAKKSKH